MENSTVNPNGNQISNDNAKINVRKGGYSNIPLLGVMALVISLIILLIGIIYFVIV